MEANEEVHAGVGVDVGKEVRGSISGRVLNEKVSVRISLSVMVRVSVSASEIMIMSSILCGQSHNRWTKVYAYTSQILCQLQIVIRCTSVKNAACERKQESRYNKLVLP